MVFTFRLIFTFVMVLTFSGVAKAGIHVGGRWTYVPTPQITMPCPQEFNGTAGMTVLYQGVSSHGFSLMPTAGITYDLEACGSLYKRGNTWAPSHGGIEVSLNVARYDGNNYLIPGIVLRYQHPVTYNFDLGMYYKFNYFFDRNGIKDRMLQTVGVVLEIQPMRKSQTKNRLPTLSEFKSLNEELFIRLLIGGGREAYQYERPSVFDITLGTGWRFTSF